MWVCYVLAHSLSFLNCIICLWLCWVFVAAGAFSSGGAWASHWVASLVVEQGLQGAWASAVAARGLRSCSSQTLEHSFNSYGARA